MQQITDWGVATVTAVAAGFVAFMTSLPTILGALLVLVIGWAIAGWLGKLIAGLCRAIRVDVVADRVGATDFLRRSGAKLKVSDLLGDVVKWVVRLVFLEMAADRLGFPQVTAVINAVLGFIPNVIVAIVVLGIGAFVAQLAAGAVRASASEAGIANPQFLAKVASTAIMAFAVIMALNELNIAPVVVNTLFIGLVGALSLALGLAFGLGGRETAARYWDRWSSGLEDTASRVRTTATPVYGEPSRTTAPLPGSTTTQGLP